MNKLALVGGHPGVRNLIPWDDLNYDIWTINEAATFEGTWVKRCTGIFQLHPRLVWDNTDNVNDKKHGEWLKKNTTVPVFMLEKYADVPMAEEYPLKEITEKYLSNLQVFSDRGRKDFYTCTVAYMCALALWKGYTEVDLYGIELSVDSEYRFQRPGAVFWLAILSQHAKVRYFGKMLDAPLYGYEAEGEIDKEYLQKRLDDINPELEKEKVRNEPLAQEVASTLLRFKETGVEHENFVKAWQTYNIYLNKYGIISGAVQELEKRLKEIDNMIEVDNNFRFHHHGFVQAEEQYRREKVRAIRNHTYAAGIFDSLFEQAKLVRLQDSKRKRLVSEIEEAMPELVKLYQEVGLYTGAARENNLLAKVIQEQRIDV